MGVANTRAGARAMQAEIRSGADPVAELKRQRAIRRQAREGIGTSAALLDVSARQKGDGLKS